MLQCKRHVARLGFIDFYTPLGDPGLNFVWMSALICLVMAAAQLQAGDSCFCFGTCIEQCDDSGFVHTEWCISFTQRPHCILWTEINVLIFFSYCNIYKITVNIYDLSVNIKNSYCWNIHQRKKSLPNWANIGICLGKTTILTKVFAVSISPFWG
jgi:hypothetical protein